eukprot:1111530-Pyramimonas_sp.AAC.2
MADESHWPETILINGVRRGSPYVRMVAGHMKCIPCDTWLQSPEHLLNKTHRQKCWWWCYGCNEPGYRQRPHCPNADWDSREINDRYWRSSHDSPPSDDLGPQDNGTQWARAAAQGSGGLGQGGRGKGKGKNAPRGSVGRNNDAAGGADGPAAAGSDDAAPSGSDGGGAAGAADGAAREADGGGAAADGAEPAPESDAIDPVEMNLDTASGQTVHYIDAIKCDIELLKTSLDGVANGMEDLRRALGAMITSNTLLTAEVTELKSRVSRSIDGQSAIERQLVNLDTVVQGMCMRGRPRPVPPGLSLSASTGALPPRNQHADSSDDQVHPPPGRAPPGAPSATAE